MKNIKKDFPIFAQQPELVFLDSAASSQKPQSVIGAVANLYSRSYANVHRGIYKLSEEATGLYEGVREKTRWFINAKSEKEIIFVKNATEAINLVAQSWGRANLRDGDTILVSQMEHHANIVPWQLISQLGNPSTGSGNIEVINLTEDYRLDLEDYKIKLEKFKPKLVAITHASNVLGTVNPVKEIIKLAHNAGAKVLIDGAQAIPHFKIDVQDLDADFYAFSAHKMLGPTGVGVLYAKQELLEQMEPINGGGDMISRVSFTKSEWNELPWKFEAGTPSIAGVVGLGAAIDYIDDIGYEEIQRHEMELTKYGLEKLSRVESLELYGPKEIKDRLGVFSFTLEKAHAHDAASILDEYGIAVRAGHHCAMPLHTDAIRHPATLRASLYIYNSKEDIDKLVAGLEKVNSKFS